MNKGLHRKICLAAVFVVCNFFISCRVFCEFCDEKYVTCHFHNSSSDTIYLYPEIRTDIPVRPSIIGLEGDYALNKLVPDSILKMEIIADDLEHTTFSFVVFSIETHDKYSIDELREKNIMDWGVAYKYDELEKMGMTIEFRGFSE